MKATEKKKTAEPDTGKAHGKFIHGFEQRLPMLAFLCLLCSLTLLLYQIHLNQTACETLESITATVPSVRWYEEEPENSENTVADSNDALAAVQSIAAVQNGKIYVLNTSSKKIHSPTCRYAVSMNAENKDTVENVPLEDLLSQGYSVCSVCHAE